MSQSGKLFDGSVTPDLETLTGDSGGAIPADALLNINILGGTGVSTVGNPATNTITINSTASALSWTRVTGTSQALTVNNGYIPTNVALTTFTLPATAAVGDLIEICGEGSGEWTIAQNAGQTIQFGITPTTTGVAGALSSTNQYDCVRLICRIANTDWSVLSSIGVLNLT